MSAQKREQHSTTYLVGGLLQLLGIERGTDAEGDARAEEDVVGDSSDTTVIDLALFHAQRSTSIPTHIPSHAQLRQY